MEWKECNDDVRCIRLQTETSRASELHSAQYGNIAWTFTDDLLEQYIR